MGYLVESNSKPAVGASWGRGSGLLRGIWTVESERTYLLRADEIKRLRERRGLSVGELAARCEVDRKTIYRWQKGGPAYMDNVAMLADVLGCEPGQLIVSGVSAQLGTALVPVAGGTPEVTPGAPKRRRKLTVAVFQLEDFDDAEEMDFLRKLARAMGRDEPPEVTDIEPANSIVITLELAPDDDERLVKAFVTGQLASLGVTRLQDADTGADVTGATIDGVHYFAPTAGPALTAEIPSKAPIKAPKKSDKTE